MFVLITSSPCMHALASQCLLQYVVHGACPFYCVQFIAQIFTIFNLLIKLYKVRHLVVYCNPTIAQPSLQIVFCTLQVFIAPQCGQFSLKLEKVLDFSSCSVSIRTAVILNSLPQFLQLAITTILTDYKLCSLNSLKLLLVIITISLI